MNDYRPIECSLHDRYEAAAVRRQRLHVSWAEADGTRRRTEGRISDIRVRDGAEYLVMSGGEEIRLDRIEETRLL